MSRDSYYGKPVIAEPVWSWEIPVYFVTGGISGVSSCLSLAARLAGNRELARRAQLAAFAGVAVSPLLLISDLGRPERFYNMLRVFKPSSPMSVGSWVLTGSGATTAVSTLGTFTGRLPVISRLSGAAAALLGLPLCTYTAVLVSDTSVPIWHAGRRELPLVFGASSTAGAGAVSTLITPHARSGPARRLAILGTAIEAAATEVMEKRLGDLAEPLHSGHSGRLARVAKAVSGAGAALLATRGRRSPPAARAGAGLVLAGELIERWSIFKAGFASAADPKYTVSPQRRRRDAGVDIHS